MAAPAQPGSLPQDEDGRSRGDLHPAQWNVTHPMAGPAPPAPDGRVVKPWLRPRLEGQYARTTGPPALPSSFRWPRESQICLRTWFFRTAVWHNGCSPVRHEAIRCRYEVREIEPMSDGAVLERVPSCEEPHPLPLCAYPKASDVAQHGIQDLPQYLPLIDLEQARHHRSRLFTTVPAAHLTSAQVLRMAQVVGTSFARREPQARHLRPPSHPPAGLLNVRHNDPFAAPRSVTGTPRRCCTGSSG
jgi:hypothetical protein